MRRESLRLILLAVVIVAVTVASQWALYRCTDAWPKGAEAAEQRDTVIIRDTVRVTAPVPAEVWPAVELRRVTLPKWVEPSEGVQESGTDTEAADSADVAVPIERKVFTDSASFRAVVSGFGVSLDTMEVYGRREVVTIKQPAPRKPWSLGLGAGYGMTPKGLQPWVGVTVSYTILRF